MEIETTLTDPEAFVVPFTMKRAYVPSAGQPFRGVHL
jgi:hypothetical protein